MTAPTRPAIVVEPDRGAVAHARGLPGAFLRDEGFLGRTVTGMLGAALQATIREAVTALWGEQVTLAELASIASGKEIGHRIAAYVDDVTCAFLEGVVPCAYQEGSGGRRAPRSMGDVWVLERGVFHPVNVKTGVVGSESHPNVVSLKKVATALAAREIDSYWLLFVKVDLSGPVPACDVDLVNLLDYLDFVDYDSGTGQLLLRARAFASARALELSSGEDVQRTPRTVGGALDALHALCEAGDARLIEVRRARREALAARVADYHRATAQDPTGAALKMEQGRLRLQPPAAAQPGADRCLALVEPAGGAHTVVDTTSTHPEDRCPTTPSPPRRA